MKRLLFACFVSAILLAGCASKPDTQTENVIPVEDIPIDIPQKASPTPASKIKTTSKVPPADCPVTVTGILSFEAPAPYSPTAPWPGFFWFGSDPLWTALPTDGVWTALPRGPNGYTQKIMWWSDKYVLKDELKPALTVTGERLDGKAPPLRFDGATNAFASDIGDAMLTGVEYQQRVVGRSQVNIKRPV